jgi:RHS repeat-associated protein
MGNGFGFQYDLDGRLTQRTAPGGIAEVNRLDADNRLLRRSLTSPAAGTLFYDTLTYDDRDKVTTAGGSAPASATYTGLGALEKWIDKAEDHYENTTKVIDPLGNLQWEDRRWVDINAGYSPQHTQQSYRYAQGTGRQLSMQEYSTFDGHITDQDFWGYDAGGNRDWHSGAHMGSSNSYGTRLMQERMQSYYGADDRLRVVDRQRCLTGVMPTNSGTTGIVSCGPWDETLGQDPSAFEEYRYDALGRRVLVRRRLYEVYGNCTTSYHTCSSSIERFVYDGDQILWEIRTPTDLTATAGQLESDAGSGDFGGRVGYTHGPGIDAPLDLIRIGHDAGTMTIVPHANWRGIYAKGTFADGSTTQGTFSTNEIPWPGPNADAWHHPIAPAQPSNWFGSLILDQRDASGLMFRRNRQYDPATGRFTEEDPIGLTGGLNLYGFGGGDALNVSDPYGLCGSAGADTLPGKQCTVNPSEQEKAERAQQQTMWNLFHHGNGAVTDEGLGPLEFFAPVAIEAKAAEGATIMSYRALRLVIRGTGLEAHHLIEKRFARLLGQKASQMLSIALTKEEHQAFTNAWRAAIPYGRGTAEATKERVLEVAADIYRNHPAILKALGLR